MAALWWILLFSFYLLAAACLSWKHPRPHLKTDSRQLHQTPQRQELYMQQRRHHQKHTSGHMGCTYQAGLDKAILKALISAASVSRSSPCSRCAARLPCRPGCPAASVSWVALAPKAVCTLANSSAPQVWSPHPVRGANKDGQRQKRGGGVTEGNEDTPSK